MPTKAQIFQVIFGWLQSESGLTVIAVNQKSPRPARPYVSLKFLNPSMKIWDTIDQQSVTKTTYPALGGMYRIILNGSAPADAVTINGNTFTYSDVNADKVAQVTAYINHFKLDTALVVTQIASTSFDVQLTTGATFATPTKVGSWGISNSPFAGQTIYHVSAEGMRKSTVSINVFGPGAVDTLARVRDSLDRPDVIELFNLAGVAHIDDTPIRDLTELLETEYEERGQMDMTVAFVSESAVDVSIIEHTTVTGTVNDRTIISSI